MPTLRCITYLAPSLSLALYEGLCGYLSRTLGVGYELVSEPTRSGPDTSDNPFVTGQAQLGFMCAPCYVRLRDADPSPVKLVSAAPLFDDPRCGGRPIYFSELLVRRGQTHVGFESLRGVRWVYNDPASLSGFHCISHRLESVGASFDFFGAVRCVGSHVNAIRALVRGEADVAAIDSNVWAIECDRDPSLVTALSSLETLGPHPVQPVVAHESLSPRLRAEIAEALFAAHRDRRLRPVLRASRILRFVPVSEADYHDPRLSPQAA